MRKSLKSILGLFLICGLLTGCTQTGAGGSATSSAAGAAGSSASSADSSASESSATASIVPIITNNTDNLYTKNNDYVLECKYQTIRLDDASAKAYPALQEALKAYSDKELKEQKERVESVKNDPDTDKIIKNSGTHFYDNTTIKIYRADRDAFSFLKTSASFLGGPHPNNVTTFAAFDPKTGKEIALTDVIKSKKDLMERVKKDLKTKYPDVEFTDLDKSLKEYEEEKDVKINWGLSPFGITIFFNAYDLAPHASGSQSVALRFDKDKDFFTGKYNKPDQGLVLPMSADGKAIMDLEGTGTPATFTVKGTYDKENEHYTGLTVSCNDKSYELKDNVFVDYYVKGIHTKDNRNYIYAFTRGYSDYPELLVFEVKGGNVDYKGSASLSEPSSYIRDDRGEVITFVSETESKTTVDTYPIFNPDKLVLSQRVDAMSTYTISKNYKINDKGIPESSDEFGTAMDVITLTVKEDIKGKNVDIEKNELKDDVTIKKGEKITIYRTNGKDTVIFKTENGSYIALKYEGEDKFNGKPFEESFDGAIFAG